MLKKIYCPICGRRVTAWDMKSKIPIHVNCKNCNKRVVFDPETLEVTVKKIPARPQSSGMRFY